MRIEEASLLDCLIGMVTVSDEQISSCPLCRGSSYPVPAGDGGYMSYDHCPNCDLIFAHESAVPTRADERARYLEHDNTMANEGYVRMLRGFLKTAILPYVSCSRGCALDFGCGPGPVLAYLMEKEGFAVRLYDPYFFPDKTYTKYNYDVIASTEVFEHLQNPYNSMRKLVQLLVPDGILAVMTHFHPGPESFSDWWYHRDPTHITFYSEKTFRWAADHLPLRLLASDGIKTLTLQRDTPRSSSGTL